MDTVSKIEVIETTLSRRGNGSTTPIRVITQYWKPSGTLLAEVDPCAVIVTPETVRAVCHALRESPHTDNDGLMTLIRQVG